MLVIGAAALCDGMNPVSASPRQQNEAAPIARVRRTAGRWLQGISTPYASRPIAVSRTSITSETTSELPIRPAKNTQSGSGVPRPRLRIPNSRSIVTDIARFWKVAETTARVMIAGT